MKFEEEDKVVYCKNNFWYNRQSFYTILIKDFYTKLDITYYSGSIVHREDGPAIEWHNGSKAWYFEGKKYTEEEYWKIINLKNKVSVLNDI